MNRTTRPFFGIFAALATALAIVALVYLPSRGETEPNIKVENTPINRDAKLGLSFAPVVKKAEPSVVNIYSTTIVHMRQRYWNPFQNDPFFQQFFGNQFGGSGGTREITRRQESLGSGVIVSPNGYILTANHVVEGASRILVKIAGDEKKYTAKVIGSDPSTDVAVLKIDAHDLPAITLGDSSQLEVGDIVLAIGNPFGVGQTVTMGIVSALGRSKFPFGGPSDGHLPMYRDFIQTDAAINPGNSGGALVDAKGRLIGINTMIISSTYGNEGIGFAIPINLARHVMDQLIQGGTVKRGYLGIDFLQDITPQLKDSFNLPSQNGVLVGNVVPGTPAEKAGINSGDVIIDFNGKKVADVASLMLMVSECKPGTKATLKVIRNGNEKSFTVKLGQLPNEMAQNEKTRNNSSVNSTFDALDGVTVSDLDSQTRQQLDVPDNIKGALVTSVDPNSNSARAGLEQGDIIVEINRQPVNNAQDAVNLCTQAKTARILLKIWRHSGNQSGTTYLSVDNREKTNP